MLSFLLFSQNNNGAEQQGPVPKSINGTMFGIVPTNIGVSVGCPLLCGGNGACASSGACQCYSGYIGAFIVILFRQIRAQFVQLDTYPTKRRVLLVKCVYRDKYLVMKVKRLVLNVNRVHLLQVHRKLNGESNNLPADKGVT